MARRLRSPFVVHSGASTGFAGPDDGEGQASLAAALAAHIEETDWIALLADDHDGRIALLRHVGGGFASDGDTLHQSRAEALGALDRVRSCDTRVFAPPDLAIEAAIAVDAGALQVTTAMELAAVPRGRSRHWKPAVVIALAGATLTGWLMNGEPAGEGPQAVATAPPAEVEVAIAGAALIDACDQALKSVPVDVPAWHTDEISCVASLQDPGILAEWPAFRSRPALVVRWSLEPGRDAELFRRLMEEHAARSWQLSSVIGETAWSLTELDPVLVAWRGGERGTFLDLRRDLDRMAGPWATAITFQRPPSQQWSVTLTGPPPLSRAHEALAAVAGLEITRVMATGPAGWRIDGRMLTPHRLLEEVFDALAVPLTPTHRPGARRRGRPSCRTPSSCAAPWSFDPPASGALSGQGRRAASATAAPTERGNRTAIMRRHCHEATAPGQSGIEPRETASCPEGGLSLDSRR